MPDGENGEQQLTSTSPHPNTNKSNDDDNDPDHSLFLNILLSTMYYLGEILLVLLLALSSYASLQKGSSHHRYLSSKEIPLSGIIIVVMLPSLSQLCYPQTYH